MFLRIYFQLQSQRLNQFCVGKLGLWGFGSTASCESLSFGKMSRIVHKNEPLFSKKINFFVFFNLFFIYFDTWSNISLLSLSILPSRCTSSRKSLKATRFASLKQTINSMSVTIGKLLSSTRVPQVLAARDS